MSRSLAERLSDVRLAVADVARDVARHPAKLPTDVQTAIREVSTLSREIDPWIEMIAARESATAYLDGLETRADPLTDRVGLGAQDVPFHHARLIGIQSRLTTTWALADRMTDFAGRILCSAEQGNNRMSRAQLLAHFVGGKTCHKAVSALLSGSMKQCFGWPIGLCYTIRNHVVHDGAARDGWTFFEGAKSASAFKISGSGWSHVLDHAQTEYRLEFAQTRAPEPWPWNQQDLRMVLGICEREIDDALGTLLGLACQSLRMHVSFLVGDA
jgi:hypothetical protein